MAFLFPKIAKIGKMGNETTPSFPKVPKFRILGNGYGIIKEITPEKGCHENHRAWISRNS